MRSFSKLRACTMPRHRASDNRAWRSPHPTAMSAAIPPAVPSRTLSQNFSALVADRICFNTVGEARFVSVDELDGLTGNRIPPGSVASRTDSRCKHLHFHQLCKQQSDQFTSRQSSSETNVLLKTNPIYNIHNHEKLDQSRQYCTNNRRQT